MAADLLSMSHVERLHTLLKSIQKVHITAYHLPAIYRSTDVLSSGLPLNADKTAADILNKRWTQQNVLFSTAAQSLC